MQRESMMPNLSVWVHAARPRTLWAAFAPVLMGTAMAWADGGFHAPAAAAALAFAFLIQIGTNFCNDYSDFLKGADTAERQGPRRVTQAGLVSPRAMRAATAVVFGLAFLAGVYLVARAGWPLIAIVLLSIVSGVLYTAGPRPLGYLGLGDLFVLVFFGPVAVTGTYLVQALTWNSLVVGAGFGPGLLSVAILAVNNLRDADQDARAGKRTLAVRFGKTFARWEYTLCLLAAPAVVAALFLTDRSRPAHLLPLLILPLCVQPIRRVFAASGPALNPLLGETARLLLIYSLLFALGRILAGHP
jgi:1,4-dihydroxy-2-naphthoate polyprenyltransferase